MLYTFAVTGTFQNMLLIKPMSLSQRGRNVITFNNVSTLGEGGDFNHKCRCGERMLNIAVNVERNTAPPFCKASVSGSGFSAFRGSNLKNDKMEHFFYDDTFCSDLEDLANVFDIDEDNVNELKDDWQVRVEMSDLEPIFNVDADNLCQLLADANEDRLSEDFDEEAKVLKALKETIDFEKLKEALPKLYYPNNKFETITKADLVEWFS